MGHSTISQKEDQVSLEGRLDVPKGCTKGLVIEVRRIDKGLGTKFAHADGGG